MSFMQVMFIYFSILLVTMENVSSSHLMPRTASLHVYFTVLMMYVWCVQALRFFVEW